MTLMVNNAPTGTHPRWRKGANPRSAPTPPDPVERSPQIWRRVDDLSFKFTPLKRRFGPCGKQHLREIPRPDFVRTLRPYPILKSMLDS